MKLYRQPVIGNYFRLSKRDDHKKCEISVPMKRRKPPLVDVAAECTELTNENSKEKFVPFCSIYHKRNQNVGVVGCKSKASADVPSEFCSMFEASMEEGEFASAVDLMSSVISERWHPPALVINSIITKVLTSESTEYPVMEVKASDFLQKLLSVYPPTSPEAVELYSKGLAAQNSVWETLANIIQNSLSSSRNTNLLSFAVSLLERNFTYIMSVNDFSKSAVNSLLLAVEVFWGKSDRGTVNSNCRHLLELLRKSMESEGFIEVLLYRLVAIVGGCLEITNSKRGDSLTLSCDAFTEAFVDICSDVALSDVEHLKRCLFLLNPVWLQRSVAEQFMSNLAAILFLKKIQSCRNLGDIVRIYMYIALSPRRKRSVSRDDQKNNVLKRKKALGNKRYIVQPDVVNSRNCKGETLLHVACAENRTTLLKSLLDIPEIDVNIKDYAGWTPLHEACNHGNIECVKTLLQWSKAISGNDAEMPLDVFAANAEGITALHDASINDHVHIAKLLLKCGGNELLEASTTFGCTAKMLSASSEMENALSPYLENAPQTPVTPRKPRKPREGEMSYEDGRKYLVLLGSLLKFYFLQHHTVELAECLKNSLPNAEKNRAPIRRDIMSFLRKLDPGRFPFLTDALNFEGIAALADDIQVLWNMENHIKNLESGFESIFGSKTCFESEISFLKFVCLF